MDLTIKMCPPFLPTLIHLSHPLTRLDFVAGNCDKGRFPPLGLVTVL